MTASVIIRCLNEAKHLPRLLEAFQAQALRPDEIIVVDSGSTDDTVAIAQAAGARVVPIPQHEFSFGRSLNRGIAAATGEVLVMASAHTYPLTDRWLERLTAPFADADVALVYGAQRGDRRTKFSEQQLLRQWFPDVSSEDQCSPFCNNANAAIRRARWEEQPYDEALPGLEDIHWAKRMLEQGYRIVYRHDAVIAHVHEESYGKIFRRYHREAMALRAISPWDRVGLRDALSMMASAVVSDLKEARRHRILWRVAGSVLGFRAAQYWGAYRGHHWRGRMTSELRARLYYPKGYRVPPPARPAEAAQLPPAPAGLARPNAH